MKSKRKKTRDKIWSKYYGKKSKKKINNINKDYGNNNSDK